MNATPGTPGRWTYGTYPTSDPAIGQVLISRDMWDEDNTRVCRMMDGEQARPDARLICAAVNAVRDAGYTVGELEAGAVKLDRDGRKELLNAGTWYSECQTVKADHAKLSKLLAQKMADLAACREALKLYGVPIPISI